MTAMQWFVEELRKTSISGETPPPLLVKQALEMEKQQIFDAYESNKTLTKEGYYNEIFKK